MSNILEALSDNIKVDKNKCTYCGKCTEACVVDNVRLKVSPCRQECPLSLNCQGYVKLIERGALNKALESVYEATPFAGVLGRICHHPCEQVCKRKEVDGQAVAIRELKRFLADHAACPSISAPEVENEKKVGIIGGGPAGAMAAYLLRRKGFQVVVYEAGARLGGMMAYHIPDFRMPQDVLARDMNQLATIGVTVRYNTVVGRDISFPEIRKDHDYVIIAAGTHVNKKLNMQGEDCQNVYDVLNFLRRAKEAVKPQVGRRVVVIGGGNTAVNAAQTALRLGAENVRVLALECQENLPAFETEVQEAMREGVLFDCGWEPGLLNKTTALRLWSLNDACRFAVWMVVSIPSSLKANAWKLPRIRLLLPSGQTADMSFANAIGITVESGLIAVNSVTKQSSLSNVFAAGDIVTGPTSVVDALAQGREAAELSGGITAGCLCPMNEIV